MQKTFIFAGKKKWLTLRRLTCNKRPTHSPRSPTAKTVFIFIYIRHRVLVIFGHLRPTNRISGFCSDVIESSSRCPLNHFLHCCTETITSLRQHGKRRHFDLTLTSITENVFILLNCAQYRHLLIRFRHIFSVVSKVPHLEMSARTHCDTVAIQSRKLHVKSLKLGYI